MGNGGNQHKKFVGNGFFYNFAPYNKLRIMSKNIFKRKIYERMLQWKRESNGRTALLIEGARRTGKSTIVEEFAKKEYESYLLIDFNKASSVIKALFDNLMDLDYIFMYLQNAYHTNLIERKSLIVFDEVQKCTKARQAIKYLVEDGRYDYIETGSLISIKKNTKDITIPSEEERIEMYPMDFEEFRWALGDKVTIPTLNSFWQQKRSLGVLHRKVMRDFRLYMLIGGMPQAIDAYINSNNLGEVDRVKRQIVELYSDDFNKIDASGRASRLFLSIPQFLSRNTRRHVTSSIVGKIEEEKSIELIRNLEESKTVNFAFHTDDPNVGMGLTQNINYYKMFVADTGLFVTMVFWDKNYTENIIYDKLLSDKLPTNLGYIYENLVAQMLIAAGNKLFYYTWERDEKHRYEIDFLLSRGNKICPIEVKSSGYNTHASLDAFRAKFSNRILQSYLIYTKDLRKDGDVLLVPPFMTMFL